MGTFLLGLRALVLFLANSVLYEWSDLIIPPDTQKIDISSSAEGLWSTTWTFETTSVKFNMNKTMRILAFIIVQDRT